ncbi:MAG: hypothetical protein RBG13Loki_2143 [Promethearchaeota archaeon CR_4]|nr:MAG: hypothetical protein RBG13Loki_2143 [Candidatus Lokiarchaeota archaeon CR_4]
MFFGNLVNRCLEGSPSIPFFLVRNVPNRSMELVQCRLFLYFPILVFDDYWNLGVDGVKLLHRVFYQRVKVCGEHGTLPPQHFGNKYVVKVRSVGIPKYIQDCKGLVQRFLD